MTYTFGIFAVYFLGGLLITLGPGQLILSIAPHPHREVKHLLEIGVGVIAAVAAIVARPDTPQGVVSGECLEGAPPLPTPSSTLN